ncbi:M20 family metallopeptidase [Ihubacter sp. rT4E-8]|uniref:M20 family metallopeptidase n=1 Tax=Ihubacter sp. rT4E-8 TaxID=3242369 RepID=UPI003CEBC8C2
MIVKGTGMIEEREEELCDLADAIFDHPENGGEEFYASEQLCSYLKKNGFQVEKGVGTLETAFRATFQNGEGGPVIGLLCEYDAVPGMGHACGHHAQGPAVIGAAIALKETAAEKPFTLVVYGTPAEEGFGGKAVMLHAGCFSELDVALMCHGGATTTTDVKSLALSSYEVCFRGKASHAAIAPEEGRSALDAALLMFQGIEFLREHVKDDTRMHYNLACSGESECTVPAFTKCKVTLRSYSRAYLDSVIARFMKIVKGAELMTETTAEVIHENSCDGKIPVLKLNQLLMKHAENHKAPCIRPSREKTGSTDFGNIMYRIPGSCIRVAFVPEGTPSHSETFLKYGKHDSMHKAMITAAKILEDTCRELIEKPDLMREIREEFKRNKRELEGEQNDEKVKI